MPFGEPTASLHPETAGEVLAVIKDLMEQDGMTTLIANHEIGFVHEVAERVVVFADGDIIDTRLPDELFTAPMQKRTRTFLRRVLSKNI